VEIRSIDRRAASALSLVLWVCGAPCAIAADADGIWLRGDGNARVRIAPCADKLCATNLWIRDTGGSEAVGDKLIMNVKPQSPGEFAGEAYDPKRNLTYSLTIKVGPDSLTTRGCIIAGMICNTMSWSRVR